MHFDGRQIISNCLCIALVQTAVQSSATLSPTGCSCSNAITPSPPSHDGTCKYNAVLEGMSRRLVIAHKIMAYTKSLFTSGGRTTSGWRVSPATSDRPRLGPPARRRKTVGSGSDARLGRDQRPTSRIRPDEIPAAFMN